MRYTTFKRKQKLLAYFGDTAYKANNFWNFEVNTKTKKLSLIILIYLYVNDDGKISFSEKRSFKKMIHSITELSKIDKKEIISSYKSLPDRYYVERYITDKCLSSSVVTSAIKFLKDQIEFEEKYLLLLSVIEAYNY